MQIAMGQLDRMYKLYLEQMEIIKLEEEKEEEE